MSDSRVDCALGVELKTIRMKNNMTLITMSEAMGFTPAQLSNYEHNLGSLTNPVHATAIDRWCVETRNLLSNSAVILSYTPVVTDISKSKAMFERWRDGDFSQESDL